MTILQVSDVPASVDYYKRIGFGLSGLWAEDGTDIPQFAIVQRGDVTLGLQLPRREAMPANSHWAVYIYVDDVDAAHAACLAAGVTVDRSPEDAPYNCRDFDLTDPDGHRIALGQDLAPDPHGPGLGSERGTG